MKNMVQVPIQTLTYHQYGNFILYIYLQIRGECYTTNKDRPQEVLPIPELYFLTCGRSFLSYLSDCIVKLHFVTI